MGMGRISESQMWKICSFSAGRGSPRESKTTQATGVAAAKTLAAAAPREPRPATGVTASASRRLKIVAMTLSSSFENDLSSRFGCGLLSVEKFKPELDHAGAAGAADNPESSAGERFRTCLAQDQRDAPGCRSRTWMAGSNSKGMGC
jgi:hypothetical protein